MIYEGEYLNGKRWNGKGRGYNSDRILILEFIIENGIEKEKNYDDGIKKLWEENDNWRKNGK